MIGKRESNKINNNIEMSASVRKTTTHSALIDNISLNTIKSNESMESNAIHTEINNDIDEENKRRNSAPIRKSLVLDGIAFVRYDDHNQVLDAIDTLNGTETGLSVEFATR
eukprot:445280_1